VCSWVVAMKPDTILVVFNFVVSDRDWIKRRVKVIVVLDKLLDTSLGSLMRLAGVQGGLLKKAESHTKNGLANTCQP
jgi:hypothetical protein